MGQIGNSLQANKMLGLPVSCFSASVYHAVASSGLLFLKQAHVSIVLPGNKWGPFGAMVLTAR
jgi:hypothetical protein